MSGEMLGTSLRHFQSSRCPPHPYRGTLHRLHRSSITNLCTPFSPLPHLKCVCGRRHPTGSRKDCCKLILV